MSTQMKRFYIKATCTTSGKNLSAIVDAPDKDAATELYDATILEWGWITAYEHLDDIEISIIWELPAMSSEPKALRWHHDIPAA